MAEYKYEYVKVKIRDLPVVVMTSKQEANRSSASRMSLKAVPPAVPAG